jgi:predicted nuclease of predicted toxin-antitoxin system
MRIYLDEDSLAPALIGMLQKAGHDVATPDELGLTGADDVTQLTRAVREDRVLLSGNHDDFQLLHLLVREVRGQHPGILTVRKDNDASRDMTPRGIFTALSKLIAAGIDIRNDFVILNHWR